MTVRSSGGATLFGQKAALSRVGLQAWDAWHQLGGVAASQPVSLLNANNTAVVFARGTDNRMSFTQETAAGNKSFSDWQVLAQIDINGNSVSSFVGDPALVRLGDGKLAVFAMASNGAVYQATQVTAGGAWANWSGLGNPAGGLKGSPVVALNANGALSVFARGAADKALWVNQQSSAGGAWRGWSSLGWLLNDSQTFADFIAVTVASDGRQVAIVNNSGFTVSANIQKSPSSTSWSGWGNLIGGAHGTSRPAVASNADGRLTVFFTENGASGPLDFQSQTAVGANSWNNWTTYAQAGSSPVAFTDVNGIIHVFGLDSSSNLHEGIQTSRNANTFSDWASGFLSGPFSGL